MSKAVVEMYLHGNEENFFDDLEGLNLDYESHRNAANWAYELQFKVEIDMKTGNTKILEINEGDKWRKVSE